MKRLKIDLIILLDTLFIDKANRIHEIKVEVINKHKFLLVNFEYCFDIKEVR